MRKVTADEILSLSAYEQVRDRFRQRIIAHKRARRISLGPEMTMVFEDHDTMLCQVQEMLRAERITAPKAVREEIDVYNDLVPPDGAILGTLMIELEDAAVRERRKYEYLGLDQSVRFELGEHVIHGELDPGGLLGDHIAVIRYVTFRLPPDGYALLLDASTTARVVVDHPRYQAATVLNEAARKSLAEDVSEENAEGARPSAS